MEYIDSLRISCSVVEARSFRRAADILGLSAPVVSRAIAGLEKRLGIRLFLLPSPLVQDDLASGRLVRVLDSFRIVDAATELRLAYSSRTLLPAKVRTFIDHAVAFFDALTPHSPPA
ncbi:hypothetical protein WL13_01625 [Burkholderia ubonensis]|uniref:LysR family transcriptional regulator n=1 Tax=Burkholderia ubonensis TaxID=101571 RepID=UPI00075E7CCC|nr:LysR family transcriptional regulator [Burkholderia ubonensis]KVR53525.1 hypothetical protein WK18_01240 [Burkholderia ubonensis]KVZ28646.1 hypothetical protein WL13_01625 [Burkholderia ubonensis]KWB86488.1 hypothetical protein WL41_26785 [Burkholderia ubonensis]OJB41258.1 hypothetical protein BGV57_17580 [Burkholderia ubonensis]